ncbi:hypothetical protein SUGI_0874880 [Cryptomeria japonica]|uniref:FT-interacting protein 7 n=1 Tax=Cryptomeria japonica TaxID=3369 RepID=UPI002414AB85|nr:FT-interacting protein 7 [Cryptomeria japonica]XP_057839689.2 FT-interacting protein 7 [Cryptomeria japonica]XP_057839690.2 FT-interacting protein 7 [Cryptomeria japonica]XP_057839691.2 FT-interacting protein 7 [Cryptomeria japonica]XP_057839692.2 FT-interacting protein 7 [Cryptomeria japonica]GLJ42264.1 hypothetical protein SUGI_0874880 [Cryptomeria japonica]
MSRLKLAVEIISAHNLMPKDGQGSASAYAEVDYAGQKFRTSTKEKDLSPVWNEKLAFTIPDPSNLPNQMVDVYVYHDNKSSQSKNFLGKVRVYGSSVVSEKEAAVQHFPLEKRGIFSNIRGDITLKIYTVNETGDDFIKVEKAKEEKSPAVEMGTRVFHHLPKTAKQDSKPAEVEKSEAKVVHMYNAPQPTQAPQVFHAPQPEDYTLKETSPHLGNIGMRRDKLNSTYDLVERMQYLYVRVVKARDLPTMDITGSCDPYVEVKIGNYKGVTKHFEKEKNPEWNQIFAFSKERLQSTLLEVVVKDKDLVKDDFIGRLIFDLHEIPMRVPPDSPLAPQWYRLEDKKAETKVKGELMLAVWMGTQADEAFPEAWHSDAAAVQSDGVAHIRSKVYLSPKLWYVRVNVIEAQDLQPSDKGRFPEVYVKVQLGNQILKTRVSQQKTANPLWNEDLLFVAAEPFEEHLVLTVEDRQGPNKDEVMGMTIIQLSSILKRFDHRSVHTKWYNLEKHAVVDGEKKESKFASRIHLRVCLDGGYHVLDESTHYSSDLRPTSKQLWKNAIGVLEVGVLSAQNLLPMKAKDGRGTTDTYCVAKYGSKWVRTRTILDSLNPKWNEQYTWEVHDPCTVITVGVFDNNHLQGGNGEKATRDAQIGKVRIRLSTLETDRVYTHSYPLLVLQPSGVKKMGELQLAVRFSCSSLMNMMCMYSRPLLPKMHYTHPLSVTQLDTLRYQAINVVALRLSRAEPPLRREVVEYMVDSNSHMWSIRRSKANFFRIISLLSPFIAISKWFADVCNWKNPITTGLVHILFLILIWYPELILPTIFLYMFLIGIWNFRFRSRLPPHMDTRLSHADSMQPDELDEEFDTFPSSRSADVVKMRYDRLRSVAGRIQTVVGDMATQGERLQSLLNWRDPRATTIFISFCLVAAVVLYVTPFQVIAVLAGLYQMRHPKFRYRLPSVPVNYFRRLPARTDSML